MVRSGSRVVGVAPFDVADGRTRRVAVVLRRAARRVVVTAEAGMGAARRAPLTLR